MTDVELIARLRAGDREVFRTLVGRYQDAVFGVAASRIATLADAEDVAQETFLAAYQSLARLKDPAKFGSCLYGIALNKVRMYLRAAKARPEHTAATCDAPPRSCLANGCANARETLAHKELRDAVMEALQRLTEAQRETAMLFYINGYSLTDIAEFTRVPGCFVHTYGRICDTEQESFRVQTRMLHHSITPGNTGFCLFWMSVYPLFLIRSIVRGDHFAPKWAYRAVMAGVA